MKKKSPRKVLSILLCVLMCVFAVSTSFVAFAEDGVIEAFSFDASNADSSADSISWWKNEANGKYYLFVPSTAELASLKVSFSANADVYAGDKKLVSGESTDAFSQTGEYTLTCGSASYTLVVLHSDSVPAMYLTTESGNLDAVHADKDYKEKGSALILAGNETVYDGGLDYIKGRGNSTWILEKKPYNIKLSEKTNLFNMGKAKTWCLIACYEEESLVRNKTVYDLAEEVGLNYSSKSQHIDLYINGQYMGAYLLTEKVEVGSNRVDITDLDELNEEANPDIDIEESALAGTRGADSAYTYGSKKWVNIPNNPADITGGYFLEYEMPNRYDAEVSGFVTSHGQPIILKTPECASEAEVSYISGYYQEFEDAVYSSDGYNSLGKYYTEYIDFDIMAKMYVLQELTKNLDAGNTSFYLYKDVGSDLFVASPVWDFDYSLGKEFKRNSVDFTDPTGYWARINQIPDMSVNPLFESFYNSGRMNILAALCQHDDFLEAASKQWSETFIPALDSILDEIIALGTSLNTSAVMEAVRWNKYSTYDIVDAQKLYTDDVAYVAEFLDSRIEFLSEQLVEDAVYLHYNANGGTGCVIDPYSYSAGGIATVLESKYNYNGKIFTGWNTESDGTGFTYQAGNYIKLDSTTTLYAQWRDASVIEKTNLRFAELLKSFLEKLYELFIGKLSIFDWFKK